MIVYKEIHYTLCCVLRNSLYLYCNHNTNIVKIQTQNVIHEYNKKLNMPLYKARILYEKGVIPKIAKEFNVSDNTVRNALRFTTEGEQPDAIREFALKYCGCALIKKPIMKTK